MINSLKLNKILLIFLLFLISTLNFAFATDSVDIWKKNENQNAGTEKNESESEVKSLILIEDSQEDEILISEEKVVLNNPVVGLFDPEENDLSLSMWVSSDGNEIKKTLKRINKINLSNFSEELLFKILFTNAYPPEKNLSDDEFLDIKINWLIKNKRIENLENLLKTNVQVSKKPKALRSLVEEYLSLADIIDIL